MQKDGAARAVLSCLVLPAFLGSHSRPEGFPELEGRLGSSQPPCLLLLKKFSGPHNSYTRLLGTGPRTHRLIKCSHIKRLLCCCCFSAVSLCLRPPPAPEKQPDGTRALLHGRYHLWRHGLRTMPGGQRVRGQPSSPPQGCGGMGLYPPHTAWLAPGPDAFTSWDSELLSA